MKQVRCQFETFACFCHARLRAAASEERRLTDHCECTCEPKARVHEQWLL
jgi:hypothetical protein